MRYTRWMLLWPGDVIFSPHAVLKQIKIFDWAWYWREEYNHYFVERCEERVIPVRVVESRRGRTLTCSAKIRTFANPEATLKRARILSHMGQPDMGSFLEEQLRLIISKEWDSLCAITKRRDGIKKLNRRLKSCLYDIIYGSGLAIEVIEANFPAAS